jgi:hypothetical protein
MANRESNILVQDDRGNSLSIPTVRFLNTTSSGLVKTGLGTVHGVVVNSHTSGTVKFSNGTTAVNDIMGTYTFPSGPQVVSFGAGIVCDTGLFVTVGGTANITVLYN